MRQIACMLLMGLLLTACVSSGGNEPGFKKPSAAEKAKQLSQIKTQLAITYMNNGDYRLGVDAIDEALKIDSRSVNAWLVRAQIWQYLKEVGKAEDSFNRALALAPESAEVNNNYGWFVCEIKKQPAESIAYFNKALTDPTYPTPEIAQLNKGICTSRMGQYQMARTYFERALAANPQFIVAHKEMARNALAAGKNSEADYLFRQYQNQVNNLQADDLLLGWKIARSMGNTQAAYEYEAQLRTKYPYSAELEQISTGH
ncbi:type IV pilus biogenesis/stability protein PilW [Neisseriaceae bacterium ESL0693]|nr:type IV pilus biogenesis/stability protein PilW [Neisseriaceae bacterium ESL0693]